MKLVEKYRPRQLKDVMGQDIAVKALRGRILKMVAKNAGKHSSIMVSGPFGTGKTTFARIIARALNCKAVDEGEPCLKCRSCKRMDPSSDGKIKHSNVVELNMSDMRGIDDVRKLKEYMKFRPMDNGWRVIILDEVHMLTPQAQNALLKPLEDSPKRCVFILVTTDPQKLIKTITSRCTNIRLRKLETKDTVKLVRKVAKKEGIKLPKKSARRIAEGSLGHPRNALNILEMVMDFLSGGDEGDPNKLIPEAVDEVMDQSPEVLAFKFIQALVVGDLEFAFKTVSGGPKADGFFSNALIAMSNVCKYHADPRLAERYYRKYLEPIEVEIKESKFTGMDLAKAHKVFIECYVQAKEYIVPDEDLLTYAVMMIHAIFEGEADE